MKLEKLNEGKSKKMLVGVIAIVAVLSIGIFAASRAKYRSTKSINIAKGTVKYNKPDLHLAEVYVANDSGEYSLATEIPSSGYEINTDSSKTRCEVNGARVDVGIEYQDGELLFSKLTDSGTKCYVYLDVKKTSSNLIPGGTPSTDNMFAGITGDAHHRTLLI